MDSLQMDIAQLESVEPEEETHYLDFFIVLLKRKRLIIVGTAVTIIMTIVFAYMMTPKFLATTKIMPPQQNSSSTAAQLLGALGGTAGLVLGAAAPTTSGDLYVGLLQSQAILYPIIDRFDLMKRYDAKTKEDASKILIDDILVAEIDSKSGILSVSVEDRDAKFASDMANQFVEELKKLLDTLAVTEASKNRLFFEEQLRKAHESLSQAEESLMNFQQSTGAINIDTQATAVMQSIAGLMTQIAAREVQINVMRGYATVNNPDLRKAEQELSALKDQLKKLEEKQGTGSQNILIPTEQIPGLGKEYIRKMRDLKYNEALYEMYAKQFEAAKVQEANEAAIIQVIYKATPPEKPAKPRKGLMVILATGLALFFFTLLAFFLEFIVKSSQNPENEERIKEMKKYVKKF
jgi:uncharacterized protein involved in exopolysaccharide biosynthesis